MKSVSEIVKEFSSLSPKIKVLTDIEDRYVYSFKNIYTRPIHPMFDIVVRDNESEISTILLNWEEEKNVEIIRKSTPDSLSKSR